MNKKLKHIGDGADLKAAGLTTGDQQGGDWIMGVSPGCPRWQQASRDAVRAVTQGMKYRKEKSECALSTAGFAGRDCSQAGN